MTTDESIPRTSCSGREHHLIRRALAMAILTFERTPEHFKAYSDLRDMKELLHRITPTDVELQNYINAARGPVTGAYP